jgi:integrator complex subunit 1
MKEFEAAARKLAATHPLLLLRNLPLLAAGMKGRTDFDFSFFRSRNHMTFYSMALGNVPRAPLLAASPV